MSVITISREFGSMGTQIADMAAQSLGYQLADKATIATILNEYGLTNFEETYDSVPGFWERFDVQKMKQRGILLSMLNRSLQALAHHGNIVIVGRGGFVVLAGLADVLNVRIQAPPEVRARRLVDAPSIGDPGLAEKVVPENDNLQKSFIKAVYGEDWDDARPFDLVIDTAKFTPEFAAETIVRATRALKTTGRADEKTAAKLEVDLVLDEAVREVLGGHLAPV